MSKPELYYSKYCKHSSEILEELNKHGLQDIFTYICIDSRTLKRQCLLHKFIRRYSKVIATDDQ